MGEGGEESHLQTHEEFEPQITQELRGVSNLNDIGDHEPLEPTRALAHPTPRLAICLSICHGWDQFGNIAVAGKAPAEIGVLCDVVGIPPPQFLKAFRRRNSVVPHSVMTNPSLAIPGNTTRHHVAHSIKTMGNPVLTGIKIIKYSLQASHI